MKTIPWYRSAILRQQIVQIVNALLLGMGVTLSTVDVDSIVGLVMSGVSVLTAVWTVITRVKKPTPPVSEEQADKFVEFNRRSV